jgi:hypothetical protein
MRDASVVPLRGEEVLELAECPGRIAVRETDRDERGVPAPLVWVQARSGFRPTADVVPLQDRERLVAQLARAP